MSNVNISYGVQVFDTPTNNLLVASRTGTFTFSSYVVLSDQRISIPASTTALQIVIPTGGQVLLIENLSSVAATVLINSNSGTALSVAPQSTSGSPGTLQFTPAQGGLTSLYITNPSSTVALTLNILVAG
jgi:hypothetical protein